LRLKPQSGANPAEREPHQLVRYVSQFSADLDYQTRNRGRKILLELANLRDDACGRFRELFPMLDVSSEFERDDAVIFRLRDQLRMLWRHEKEEDSFAALHVWTKQSLGSRLPTWVVWSNSDGTFTVAPNYEILPLALALAASAWQAKMAVCKNPDCLQQYFLKRRTTQQFCDNDVCLAFGQRQHKLTWWNDNGDEWKRRRASKPKRLSRKRSRPVR
jgi:hypothetical protein